MVNRFRESRSRDQGWRVCRSPVATRIGWRPCRFAGVLVLLAVSNCVFAEIKRCEAGVADSRATEVQQPYPPKWDLLKRHPIPQWYCDAKFGIYYHWGVYSVPAFGSEWYARNMYQKGSLENQHHLKTYGPLTTFGYKDFIPMFKAEKFNPDDWAELFERSGAKFAGPAAEHSDGFSMWDSKLTKWNAAQMGPKRDLVGDMEKAVRKRGMKFVVTFHHQWLWAWYPTDDRDVDASNPQYSGLYGPVAPQTAFAFPPQKILMPGKEFCDLWEAKIKEVIDKYQPDLVYLDSRMFIIDERHRQDFLAYYYNWALAHGREVAVTYKEEPEGDLHGAGIVDIERGRMAGTVAHPWQDDDTIDRKSWGYIENPSYKSTKRLIDELVDTVSKNGCLLLNIPPKADGAIPEPVKERLLHIGAWLRTNGEAIYGTRPWAVFGEGPTAVKAGYGGEEQTKDFVAQDIRFTTKDTTLYAICSGWPGEKLVIKSLASGSSHFKHAITDIRLLGSDTKLKWLRDRNGLAVFFPAEKPCEHAYVLKILRQ